MTGQPTISVADEGGRLIRVLKRWTIILGLCVAFVPSVVYLQRIIGRDDDEFSRSLDLRVEALTAMVYVNSRLWGFEVHRIKDILEPARSEPWRTTYRVDTRTGDRWNPVAEVDGTPVGPTRRMEAAILDGDRVVGRVVGVRDINHLLIDVVVVAAVSILLGGALAMLIWFRALPLVMMSMERLERNERQISGHRDALEVEVTNRTVALANTNERLSMSLNELTLRESENEELAAIARGVDSAIVILGPDGAIVWANPAFTTVTGYEFSEAKGKTPGSLLNGPATDQATVARLQAALLAGEPYETEILQYTKSGAPRWIEAHATMLHDDQGRTRRCILVGRDVTERRAQQERLDEALTREREINQQQRRFVSVVAHEFRTPLTIIDGAAQRLARNAERITAADIHERVAKVRRAVARMGELIETSLDAARIDSGALDVKREAVDLTALLAGVSERIRSIATDFDIQLNAPATPVTVTGDQRLLDQVLTNLLTNAVKYSGDSRRIELTLAIVDGDAQASIRDHGLGIPADELPKLFTRFYRASTGRGLPGTGIGLNLARELAAMHDGEITVTSAVGEGSIFKLRLPLRTQQERCPPVQAA